MRNSLADAAERLHAVQPAAADDDEVGRVGRVDERLDRMRVDGLRERGPEVHVTEIDCRPAQRDEDP